MKKTKNKTLCPCVIRKMIAILLVVGAWQMVQKVPTIYAAETGTTYTASTSAYYEHPVTGEVEDSGNNPGIGQGMTESVTASTALIEQTDGGAMYATVRLSMMDNISDVRFFTQSFGDSGWSSASSSVMQENAGGDYTSDFRFEIPNESAVVKVQFYVAPMGRDIIYFITFSNFEEGSGDFIVSVSTSQETGETGETTSLEENNEETQTKQTSESETTKVPTSANLVTTTNSQVQEKSNTSQNKVEAQTQIVKSGARQLMEEADGLVLSDESLLKVDKEEALEEGEKDASLAPIQALPWTLVLQCILILTIPGVLAGMLLFFVITIQQKRERDRQ